MGPKDRRGSGTELAYRLPEKSVPTIARKTHRASPCSHGVPARCGRWKCDPCRSPGSNRPTTSRRGGCYFGFHEPGGDSGLEWIGSGTVESVRVDLGSLGFRAVAQATIQALLADRDDTDDDPDRTAAEVGSALGARWVVQGSYQRLGARLRLTAHLYDLTLDGGRSASSGRRASGRTCSTCKTRSSSSSVRE